MADCMASHSIAAEIVEIFIMMKGLLIYIMMPSITLSLSSWATPP